MEFIYEKQRYTKESFMAEFGIESEQDFNEIFENLKMRNLVKDADLEQKTPQQAAFEKFMKENEIRQQANYYREKEETEDVRAREKKTENVPKYKSVSFEFDDEALTGEFVRAVIEKGIDRSNISIKLDHTVILYDITEAEARALVLIYNAQKATASTNRFIKKTAKTATNVVGYAAANVAMPILKTAFKAGGELLKTVTKTAVKAGSAAVTTLKNTSDETAFEIVNDPDVITAMDDLTTVKDDIRNKFGGITSKGVSFNS